MGSRISHGPVSVGRQDKPMIVLGQTIVSRKKRVAAASPIRKQEPIVPNPLDIVPEKIPFDVPYGPPISLERAQAAINVAVAEAKNHDWKMNVAVVDSGGNLVAFQRMDGAMLASIQIAEHMARAAATFRRETRVFERYPGRRAGLRNDSIQRHQVIRIRYVG